ncbi:MAG: hypothetical protein U1E27_14130 [Kiritimatiellia bacterium]|nr:hypothetical protein [Kiritimatiellia bacterium]
MWYNHRENRHGTLWEDRFKSILVEGRGHALATLAAYIDLIVESVFQSHRGYFSAKRKTGARPMKKADWGGLCTARALRMEPVAVSS